MPTLAVQPDPAFLGKGGDSHARFWHVQPAGCMHEKNQSNTLVYQRHAPAVFRRARQILGNAADAREIVQDVFLSLFEAPHQFRGKSSLSTFLYSATTHACLNRVRNQRNRERLIHERFAHETAEADPRLS